MQNLNWGQPEFDVLSINFASAKPVHTFYQPAELSVCCVIPLGK